MNENSLLRQQKYAAYNNNGTNNDAQPTQIQYEPQQIEQQFNDVPDELKEISLDKLLNNDF